MEEILASIRRIIADDQSLPGRARAEEPVSVEAELAAVHVLHADDAPTSVERPAASADSEPAESESSDSEPAVAPHETEASAMMGQGSIAAPQFPSPEMPASEPAVPALMDRLEAIHHQAHGEPAKPEIATRLGAADDHGDVPDEHDRRAVNPSQAAPLFSATTNSAVASAFNVLAASRLADNSEELLGLAREMIRPLLRSWLDENLPSMVERLVRDEIERVARGGR